MSEVLHMTYDKVSNGLLIVLKTQGGFQIQGLEPHQQLTGSVMGLSSQHTRGILEVWVPSSPF